MKALKITSRIFAVLAVFFVLIAILVAAGVAGNSSGFLDLSNIVAIAILGIALVCSVVLYFGSNMSVPELSVEAGYSVFEITAEFYTKFCANRHKQYIFTSTKYARARSESFEL